MKEYEIKFTTTPSRTQLTGGKVCYQGQLQHNRVLDAAETRRRFADYMHVGEPQSNLYVDSLGEFIVEMVERGYRVDFGPFSVGLKMRGGFPAANSPYDPMVNSIGVELMPGGAIKSAAKALNPVNMTADAKSRLYTTLQLEPFKVYDTIVATGNRKLITTGDYILVHPGAVGEGIWVENDLGEKLLEGTVIESDNCRAIYTLTGTIAPGNHWLVICSRAREGGELLRAHRRLAVKGS